ncbi:MAG: rhamnulokinase [Blautia sp.]|nr:rhamnulokinase [Lachnoclostridium sp.]MCM1212287.1 rhamnulokinase [Blautia sp.]
MHTYYLSIDIGASSGRHILAHMENGKIELEEIYRFDNKQIQKNGHVCWDLENLWNGILEGMKSCGRLGRIPKTIGIDTWGVDYVLLDQDGQLIGDAVAYRDSRTDGIDQIVDSLISEQELYQRTGIQKQLFNTLYQLVALKEENPEQLLKAKSLLMLPDYFNFLLTGVMKQEYTNATTTNLVNAADKKWDYPLIETLGLPKALFGPLSMPGTTVGQLLPAIQEQVGFSAEVILPATHDTGSAYLAVPAQNYQSVYLSSGTWSLLGVESEVPVTTEESRKENFTNEGGAWYRYRYLKNIMGLWMIQSIRRELNGTEYVAGRESKYKSDKQWSFGELAKEAKKAEGFTSVVDVNHASFLAPASMIDAVRDYCGNTGQQTPESIGELMQCVYKSLALCYKDAIIRLSSLTNRLYTGIHIVGGGCQDMYLNHIIARTTGLPVWAGPIEGTAIGNLIVQFIANGEFEDLQSARDAIRESFDIKEITMSSSK